MRRIVTFAVAFLAVAAGWILLQRAAETRRVRQAHWPRVEGDLVLAGPAAPLRILRDARGVPHVEAESEADAYFGLGFVHAQDRLGQMASLWLAARGRTAEVLGEAGLPADRLARVVGLGAFADRQAERLDPPTARLLRAYAAGVNARLARLQAGEGAWPAQFGGPDAVPFPFERWEPADSVAVLKAWAWGLGASLETSLVLDDLLRHLGPDLARPFFPAGAGVAPLGGGKPSVARAQRPEAPAAPAFRDPLRRGLGLQAAGVGSSAWALAGAATASGKPILAADAHLEATVPAHLHEAHLRGGGLDVVGVAVPGIPVFWSGANARVAWAATAARASLQDLYVESLGPEGEGTLDAPGRYHDGLRWKRLAAREEILHVRGGAEERLVVRESGHGPLVNPILDREREPLALAWTGRVFGDGIGPMLRAARAGDGAAFVAALAKHHEPALAFVWVDAAGGAGLKVAGFVPRRALPSGLVPVSGRSAWADWQQGIPADRLPARAPTADRPFVVAADGPLEPGPSRQAEWLWRTGDRQRRIEALLAEAAAAGGASPRAMAALQLDVLSDRAGEILEPALALAGSPAQLAAEEREIHDLLQAWDGRVTTDSAAAAAYHVFLAELCRALFEPVLGTDLYERWLDLVHASPAPLAAGVLSGAAAGRAAPTAVPEWTRERVAAAVRDALRKTWLQFGVRVGPNRDKWSWGRLHELRFRPFGVLRFPGGEPAELGPHPFPGDAQTVAPAGYDWREPFAVRAAATHRMAVDAAELDTLLVSQAPGQVEQAGHPHRLDGVADWLAGRPALLLTSPVLLEEQAVATLRIVPEVAP